MFASRDLVLLNAAASCRSASVGMLGVVLAVYLSRAGFSATVIGLVIAAGLAGNATATAIASQYSERCGRRRSLLLGSMLAALGGAGLVVAHSVAAVVLVAFVCMLNGMGTDRSPMFAIEQATIPSLVRDQDRTWTLSWYNVVLDTSGALGALAGALPIVIQTWMGASLATSYRAVFVLYLALNVASAAMYLLLDASVETRTPGRAAPAAEITPEARRIVRRIASLFALDSAGGGFLADALLAYWFFERFGVNEKSLGVLFFVVRVLNALSHLGAAWLAQRIGLVRTMVFTHLPSSVFLLLVPLAPTFSLAAVLLLLREALVEMDVPTRQSYVAAMVQPHERVYASGVTNLTRTGAWALSASAAGALMQHIAFSAPLVLGGSMKIIYDVLLYRNFRHLRPPEERQAAPPTQGVASPPLPSAKGSV